MADLALDAGGLAVAFLLPVPLPVVEVRVEPCLDVARGVVLLEVPVLGAVVLEPRGCEAFDPGELVLEPLFFEALGVAAD